MRASERWYAISDALLLARHEELPPFARDAVVALTEQGARIAARRDRPPGESSRPHAPPRRRHGMRGEAFPHVRRGDDPSSTGGAARGDRRDTGPPRDRIRSTRSCAWRWTGPATTGRWRQQALRTAQDLWAYEHGRLVGHGPRHHAMDAPCSVKHCVEAMAYLGLREERRAR